MNAFVAFLRAVNVGGTGKLAMSELRSLCQKAGFEDVRTYIQTGNVVLRSRLGEDAVRVKLEKLLATKMGRPCGVMIRTARELDRILAKNPFPEAAPNRVIVFFMNDVVSKSSLAEVKNVAREEIRLAGRDAYVHYPDGQGPSKLKLPFASVGTGRNLNTVKTLAEMARAAEDA